MLLLDQSYIKAVAAAAAVAAVKLIKSCKILQQFPMWQVLQTPI